MNYRNCINILLWFNDNNKDNIKEMISFQLLVMLHLVLATTFGTSEFVPVAGYSASGHSAHNLVLLNLVLTIWSF